MCGIWHVEICGYVCVVNGVCGVFYVRYGVCVVDGVWEYMYVCGVNGVCVCVCVWCMV